MRIISDFRDYYDIASGTGLTFERISRGGGPSKQQQFDILSRANWTTPKHGSVGSVRGYYWPNEKIIVDAVVIYDNPMAHCGEGKRLVTFDTYEHSRDHSLLCSAFVGNPKEPGYSLRRLQAGPHVFWIEYESYDSWMSNVGEGNIRLLDADLNHGYHSHIPLPLFAVDFVHGTYDTYAIDFNIAPDMRWTGIEKYVGPFEMAKALEQAIIDLGDPKEQALWPENNHQAQ